jgi:hypothetical protein
MYRRPRNRVARDIAERLIARRLVRQLMIEYEYLSGVANRPWCWLLGHEGPGAPRLHPLRSLRVEVRA